MKVENMTSARGNMIANQFIITDTQKIDGEFRQVEVFQSYNSIIAKRVKPPTSLEICGENEKVLLDRNKWDYSVTTGKYRNQFLGETKKETQKKIDSGEYKLVDLN